MTTPPPSSFLVKPSITHEWLNVLATPPRHNRFLNYQHIRELSFAELGVDLFPLDFPHLSQTVTSHWDVGWWLSQVTTIGVVVSSPQGFSGALNWIEKANLRSLRLILFPTAGYNEEVYVSIQRHTQLEQLDLDIGLDHLSPWQKARMAEAFLESCRSLRNLTNLRLSLDIFQVAPSTTLMNINLLPALEEMVIVPSWVSVTPQEPAVFGSMQYLKLSRSVQQAHGTGNRLSRLQVDLVALVYPAQFHECIQSFASWGSTFSEVVVNIIGQGQGNSSWITVPSLALLRGVEQFTIHSPHPLNFSANDLLDIFQSWPRVRTLILNSRALPSLGGATLPTIDCLSAVAQSAPHLRVFHAFLNCRQSVPHIPGASWAPTLISLDLGNSVGSRRVTEIEAFARFIDILFPEAHMAVDGCSEWVQKVATALYRLRKNH